MRVKKVQPYEEINISDYEASILLHKFNASLSDDKTIRPEEAKKIIEDKIRNINSKLSEYIIENTKKFRVTLTDDAYSLINSDLVELTEYSAYSGLTEDEINYRNEKYLESVFTSQPEGLQGKAPIDKDSYKKIKFSLFPKRIKLTINSIPRGAEVKIAERVIGKTQIKDWLFRAKGKYTITFEKKAIKLQYENTLFLHFQNSKSLQKFCIKNK